MELFKNPQFDFVGKRHYFIGVSAIIIVAGLISLIIKGGPTYGVDFTGGLVVQVRFTSPVTLSEIRQCLDPIGFGNSQLQNFGSANEFLIRLVGTTTETEGKGTENSKLIEDALKNTFKDKGVEIRRIEMVGPRVGKDLRRTALLAVIGATIGICIYVAFRFDLLFGVAAIVSLIHDVLITVGIFSIVNKEVDMTIIAALLTIVGYSINDTIVVYDRIRENQHLVRKQGIAELINRSINQTLSRTVLTVGTVLMVLIALFFWGGEVIHDFSFAMLVGIVSGCYSSIYIAAPIIIDWNNFRQKRAKLEAAKRLSLQPKQPSDKKLKK